MTSVSRCAGRSRLPVVAGDCHKAARRQGCCPSKPCSSTPNECMRPGGPSGTSPPKLALGAEPSPNGSHWTILPDRQRSTIKPSSPLYFQDFLARRLAAGDRVGRRLFHDVRARGYVGSFSHLERLLSTWRTGVQAQESSPPKKIESLGEGRADLVDGRRFALYEADVDADTVRGRERRHFEGGLAELCSDAATGDAVLRSSLRRRPKEA